MGLDPNKPKGAHLRSWHKWLIAAGVLLAAYFINVEVQTVLGNRALEATGLQSMTFEAALDKARIEKKLVLVDVSAIWCPSCRALDKQVFGQQQVRSVIESAFVFSRLEYESEAGKALLKHFEVSGVPTLLLINGSGDLIKQLPITYDPDQFVGILKDYL